MTDALLIGGIDPNIEMRGAEDCTGTRVETVLRMRLGTWLPAEKPFANTNFYFSFPVLGIGGTLGLPLVEFGKRGVR